MSRTGDAVAQMILVSTGHAERASVRALLSATGSPAPALPLAVVHDPWWTTACCLDDLADSPDGQETADPEVDQTLLAVVAAGTPLPLPIVQKLRVPEPVRAALAAEVVRCWVDAAEGQLRDIGGEAVTATRSSVRKTCLGKSGAPFAVITAMAARLAGAASSAWHAGVPSARSSGWSGSSSTTRRTSFRAGSRTCGRAR
ncbi:hypothetical protein BIV25_36650 [Streptomyces sp. MUSC 14]|nr:hypothetical protein BIV25_36650 [Streptomyces sp. MUSC 14]